MKLKNNSFIYVLTEKGASKPILVTEDKDRITTLLFEYMGIGYNFTEPQPKYVGFEPHDDRGYVDPFEGTFVFETEEEPQYFLLHCLPLNELL